MNGTKKSNACPSKKSKQASPESEAASFWKKVLLSYLLTLGVTLLLLLVCSLGAYFTPDPNALTLPMGLISSALSAFLGGIISIRIHRKNLLAVTLLNALLMNLGMILLSIPMTAYATGHTTLISILLHAGYLLLSPLGGLLGHPGEKREKKKKKRTEFRRK